MLLRWIFSVSLKIIKPVHCASLLNTLIKNGSGKCGEPKLDLDNYICIYMEQCLFLKLRVKKVGVSKKAYNQSFLYPTN